MMAKEIDEAMGGLYSELGQTFQTHAVRRFVALHYEEDKGLPKLPDKFFRVAIISAIDAMGRSTEGKVLLETTMAVLGTFKEEAGRRLNVGEFIRRMYTSASIPQAGLVKTEDQVQGEQQQMMKASMMQEVVSKGAGPAAAALAKGGMGALQAGQQQQQGPGAPDGSPPSPQDAQSVAQPPAQ